LPFASSLYISLLSIYCFFSFLLQFYRLFDVIKDYIYGIVEEEGDDDLVAMLDIDFRTVQVIIFIYFTIIGSTIRTNGKYTIKQKKMNKLIRYSS